MGFSTVLKPEDLLIGELVSEPGWQPCVLKKWEEKEAGTDKSANAIFYFEIIDGKDKGKSGRALFNEKAFGMGKKLWAVIVPGFDIKNGGALSPQVFDAAVGKKLKVYFKRGKSNQGNEFNDPTDYMPLT